jgi:hypothetical protein
MLEEFADLLAIPGGNSFKVRAYEKAARAVAGYHAEVAGPDEKQLDDIPNVGSHLAHKIVEYLETDSVDELEELRSRVDRPTPSAESNDPGGPVGRAASAGADVADVTGGQDDFGTLVPGDRARGGRTCQWVCERKREPRG